MPVPAIIYALGGLVLLAGGAAFCQGVAAARDRKKYPAPGRLVDVGGYRLHINCTGVKDGRASAVILEAAAASWSAFWCLVQPEIARITRVCSYDRAGLGWSDPGPSPRTSQQIADELHRLLTSAAIEPPYILVGHSLGGYHTRLFASRFSEEVAGIVLVDASHEDQASYLSPRNAKRFERQFGIARMSAPLGIVRLIGSLGLSSGFEAFLGRFPRAVQKASRAIYYSSQYWRTAAQEARARAESAAQVRTLGSLGDKPLVVITALGELNDERTKQNWMEKQAQLARLSSKSTHLFAEQSSHYIPFDQPELVVKAIRLIIGEVTAGAPNQ